MKTWQIPTVPLLPGEPAKLYLYDSNTKQIRQHSHPDLRLWVCGITPYDATHLGHANTYVFFDILVRTWQDGGRTLHYAQNLTDIDDPLFERAAATGVDWRNLAAEQTQLFRSDMEYLRVIPPQDWVSVSEALPALEEYVRNSVRHGHSYELPNANGTIDLYTSVAEDKKFTSAPIFKNLDLPALFSAHGGDTDRAGKHHPLDPLLWKGIRRNANGDDYCPADLDNGGWRPGWHIECALIAWNKLGRVDVQGGGADLLFPHHEMSELHLREIGGENTQVGIHMHSGLVAYAGEKMSKSLGNLILVSELVAGGVDPRAIRLAIICHHYRENWEYKQEILDNAQHRLENWRKAVAAPVETAGKIAAEIDETGYKSEEEVLSLLQALRSALANDLDTPQALSLIDSFSAQIVAWESLNTKTLFVDIVDGLLGIRL